ncbi:peptidoglycan DD-metalloendopeptidase family protein, partial [Leptospira sp. 96542]|nr:peptidoglycan DD-metalloendopeptidase family protein [Leptospira sp. 96542]
ATTTMVTNASTGLLEVSKTAITAVSSMANAVVQGAYGARNGIEGALAGITNGLLGGITQLAGPIDSGLLKGITPGLGVTYHPDDGWGGMIGLGNATMNASVSFSQRGNTTVQGSYALGDTGAQLTADYTTNNGMNVGIDINEDKGPRKDWNLSFNYDLAGGGLSASLGYTDPDSTLGLTSTIDRNGLSTSAELTGVSIATNGPNGFQMDEINFAEQNINAAQDKTQKDQDDAKKLADSKNILAGELGKQGLTPDQINGVLNSLTNDQLNGSADVIRNERQAADDRKFLRDQNVSDDDINGMSAEALAERAAEIRDSQVNLFDTFTGVGTALGGLALGGLAIVGGLFGSGNGAVPSPNTSVVAADEPVRRREDEEGGENVNDSTDRDLAAAYDPEDFETGVIEEEEEEESNEKDKKSKPREVGLTESPQTPFPAILRAVEYFQPINKESFTTDEVKAKAGELAELAKKYKQEIDEQIKLIKESDPKLKDPQNKELVKQLQKELENSKKVVKVQEAQVRSQEIKVPLIDGIRPNKLESGVTNMVTYEQNKTQSENHEKLRESIKDGQLSLEAKQRLEQEKMSTPEYKKLQELQNQKTKLENDFLLNSLGRVNDIKLGDLNNPIDLNKIVYGDSQQNKDFLKARGEIQKQIDKLNEPIKKIDSEYELKARIEKYREMGIDIEYTPKDKDLNYKLRQIERAFEKKNSRQDQIVALRNLEDHGVSISKPLYDTVTTPTEGVALKPAPGQGNLSIYQNALGMEIRRPIPLAEKDVVTSLPDKDRLHPIKNEPAPHDGTDYGLKIGTPLGSVMEGRVVSIVDSPTAFLNYADGGPSAGAQVVIESINHDPKIRTTYYHLSHVNVEPNMTVKMGDLVGKSGNSGNSVGPHLHFIVQVHDGKNWVLQKNEEFDWTGVP